MSKSETRRRDESSLLVTDGGIHKSDAAVSIESLFSESSIDDLYELTAFFYGLSVDDSSTLPLYQILLPHLIYTNGGSLLDAVIIHRRLVDDYAVDELDRIEYAGENATFGAILADVCSTHDVKFDGRSGRQSTISMARPVISDFARVMALLLSQVVGVIAGVIGGRPDISETLIVPYPGRSDRISPVFEELDCEFTILTNTHPPLSWFLSNRSSSLFSEHDVVSFASASRFSSVVIEAIALLSLGYDYFRSGMMVAELEEGLEAEYGVTLPRTVRRAYVDAIGGDLRDICLAIAVSDIVDAHDCERVVIGGLHPRERAITLLSARHGASIRYLPHSLESQVEQFPPVPAKQYVSADHVEEHFEATATWTETNYLSTGFPFLAEIDPHREDSSTLHGDPDSVTVMVATQNRVDWMRRRFIEMTMAGLSVLQDSINADLDVTIKLHPDEDGGYYTDVLRETDSAIAATVSIVNDDLTERLLESDLVVTMNSNVGLEGMVLGTPCVNINPFQSISPVYLYAHVGPVPVLERKSDVDAFFRRTNTDDLQSLAREQLEFATEEFVRPEAGFLIAGDICEGDG